MRRKVRFGGSVLEKIAAVVTILGVSFPAMRWAWRRVSAWRERRAMNRHLGHGLTFVSLDDDDE